MNVIKFKNNRMKEAHQKFKFWIIQKGWNAMTLVKLMIATKKTRAKIFLNRWISITIVKITATEMIQVKIFRKRWSTIIIVEKMIATKKISAKILYRKKPNLMEN